MKLHVQWCICNDDPRYNGDPDDEEYNDGVLREVHLNIKSADELKDWLLRFRSTGNVRTSHGWLIDYFYICYTQDERKSRLFEEDLKEEQE